MTTLSTISQGATLAIEPDELLGLTALAELDKADGGKVGADAVTEARTLMRRALADKLEETGLPWAPSPEVVRQRAEAAEPEGAVLRLARNGKVRKVAAYVLAVAALVVLWGGYAHGWQWTGLRANGQLWDWLTLLLLPVVLGTIPLWMQDRKYISHRRRVLYGAAVVAWIAFVIAGYLVPLNWTGFRGQKLADWLQLLLIPAAVTVTMAMISRQGQAAAGPLAAALPCGNRRRPGDRLDHHPDRRLPSGVDVDGLCRSSAAAAPAAGQPLGLARAAPADRPPGPPAAALGQVGHGQRGRACREGGRGHRGRDGRRRARNIAEEQICGGQLTSYLLRGQDATVPAFAPTARHGKFQRLKKLRSS